MKVVIMGPTFSSAGGVCVNFIANGGSSWTLYLEWESLRQGETDRLYCAIYSCSNGYLRSKCYLEPALIGDLLSDLEKLEAMRDSYGKVACSMHDMWNHSGALPEPYDAIWKRGQEDRRAGGGAEVQFRLRQIGERIELYARFEEVELDLPLSMDTSGCLCCSHGHFALNGETFVVERLKGILVPPTVFCTTNAPPFGNLIALIPSLPAVIEANAEAPEIEVHSWWTSGVTFEAYPVQFRVRAPDVTLDFAACREKQEIQIPLGMNRMWFGFCNVVGAAYGREVREACLVLFRAENPDFSTDSVLDRANTAVMEQVDALLKKAASTRIPCQSTSPCNPAESGGDCDWESVLEPIRAIAIRGGKGWRGYLIALCCEAVGGDFARHRKWLAFSEVLHIGSLIVDDVQDDSAIRRGGPASHILFGVPSAINSGTLSYFLAKHIFDSSELAPDTLLKIYKEYIDLMWFGHIGQGLDIHQTLELLSEHPNTNEISDVWSRAVMACKLKSGVPFEKFARIGALLGGGSTEDVQALGDFFLELGTCFQFVDDILNIEGFSMKTKERGEDIRGGKLTTPVICYLSLAEQSQRSGVAALLRRARTDSLAHSEALRMIVGSAALDLFKKETRARLGRAWQRLDEALPYSFAKILIQSFSERVLDRPY